MARIPEPELERLKQEISLERLVEAKGIKLERHGQDLIGLCPFHDDKSPSLVISPNRNLWHCLGACQAGGSMIDWVMKAEGVSFRHAVDLSRNDSPSLAARLPATRTGRPPNDGRSHVKTSTVKHLESAIAREADAQTALQQAVAYYHETLMQSPEALAYLEKRGLRSSEMVERFKLGFCDRTLGYRLPKLSSFAPKTCRRYPPISRGPFLPRATSSFNAVFEAPTPFTGKPSSSCAAPERASASSSASNRDASTRTCAETSSSRFPSASSTTSVWSPSTTRRARSPSIYVDSVPTTHLS